MSVRALLLPACCLSLLVSCHRHQPVSLPAPEPLRRSPSYIDLRPGWRVRVVTPVNRSGSLDVKFRERKTSDYSATLEATSDFLGYEEAYYTVTGGNGVRFASAEEVRDQVRTPKPKPMVNLFRPARGMRHVRLLYLIRRSTADHNMAILAARDMASLEALTRAVEADPPGACRSGRHSRCSWVPVGIAVVAEMAYGDAWMPAVGGSYRPPRR